MDSEQANQQIPWNKGIHYIELTMRFLNHSSLIMGQLGSTFLPRPAPPFFFCYCNILNICSIPNVILLCKCYTHLQCTPVSSVQFPKPLKVLRNMTVKLYI